MQQNNSLEPQSYSTMFEVKSGFKQVCKWAIFNHDRFSFWYRSGTVNSKSFVGKVLLLIKQKFELNSTL